MKQNHSIGSPRKNWGDLIVKVLLVVTLGLLAGHYILPRYVGRQPTLTDLAKWQARPKLEFHPPGRPGNPPMPCLFLVPPSATDPPAAPGQVAACLTLVPDGQKRDVVELNLASGEVFPVKTDLYVPDSIPLAFTRTYHPPDGWARRFQVALPHVYDPYLTGSRPYIYSDWLLPDRQTIHFERISPGSGYADYIGERRSGNPVFRGSRIAWNGWGWDLALPDGSTFLSPEAYNATRPQQGSLAGIFDQAGREIKLERTKNGDLEQITSPSGRWIRLGYNLAGQVSKATNSAGESVDYAYDEQSRLTQVQYAGGRKTTYSYNQDGLLTNVFDSPSGFALGVAYDGRHMPEKLTVNGTDIALRYATDGVDKIAQRASVHVDLLMPGAAIRVRMVFSPQGVVSWSAENPGKSRTTR